MGRRRRRLTIERGDKFIGQRTVEKYIWRDAVELYDLEADPNEVANLADDRAYVEVRRSRARGYANDCGKRMIFG